jgi:prepilin signal peptidase PulO-like enzyme (type II secretory pathway)
MFGVGIAVIVPVWNLGGARWESLLTSLIGVVAGGGIVWAVRIIGALTLRREAMGFGDVTLMAMIGATLGWQAALRVFFIAPFFGLSLFVAQAVAARDAEIPYGPSLCLGALAVILRWPVLWIAGRDVFAVWWLVPATLMVLLAFMAVLLGIWGAIKRRFLARPPAR